MGTNKNMAYIVAMIQSPSPATSTTDNNASNKGLIRTIGLVTAILLVVSQMIGSGVFKKVTIMAAGLPSPTYIMLAWLIAGGVSMVGALTNSEVCGIIADPGGQYAYFRKMYGRFFAFLFGWASFAVIQSATIASVAYVFAQSVNTVMPLPRLSPEMESYLLFGFLPIFNNLGVKGLTIILIGGLTTINILGVKYGSKVSDVLATLIAIAIIFIIITAFGSSKGSWDNITHDATEFSTGAGANFGSLFSALFPAMMAAFWAYEGWNNMGYLGGEIKKPERYIPLSLIIGVGFVMLLYTTVNLAYLYVLPVEQLVAISKDENSIGAVAVMEALLGNTGVIFVSSLILVATFNSTNGVILTASRLYYAMALDRLFFKQAAVCHPVNKTPSGSLILQAVWSSILVLSASFDILTDMLVFAAFIFYGAMAAGVFILRSSMPNAHRPVRALGYPILPAIFVLFCAALVLNTLVVQTSQSLWGLALIGSGVPFYLYWQSIRKPVAEA